MSKIWTQPARQWLIGELVDDLKLNEITNALEWLKDKPFQQNSVTNGGTNFVQLSAGAGTWYAPSDDNYTLNVTTYVPNEVFRVDLFGEWSTASAAGASGLFWDVLIDGSIYGSSGLATSISRGFGQFIQQSAANVKNPVSTFAYITIPTAGDHTIKLRLSAVSGTTFTWFMASAGIDISRFAVLDI